MGSRTRKGWDGGEQVWIVKSGRTEWRGCEPDWVVGQAWLGLGGDRPAWEVGVSRAEAQREGKVGRGKSCGAGERWAERARVVAEVRDAEARGELGREVVAE